MAGGNRVVEDAIIVCITVFSIMAFVANSSVLLLVITIKQLRTYVNGFVMSLALSDILLSIALYSYLADLHLTDEDRVEKWPRFVIGVASLSELGNLCAVTYERYLAVVKPFQYRVKIKKYFSMAVPLTWICSISVSSLAFVPLSHLSTSELNLLAGIIGLPFVLIPFFIIIIFYFFIFASLAKRQRTVINLGAVNRNGLHQRKQREGKVAKMFAVVASLYLFSTIPILLHESVQEIKKFVLPGCETSFAILLTVAAFVLSSLANPFIYTLTKQDFKQQIQKKFRKICCHVSNEVQQSGTKSN